MDSRTLKINAINAFNKKHLNRYWKKYKKCYLKNIEDTICF